MKWYINLVLKYRFLVLALLALLTGVALWSASRAVMSTRLGEDMLGNQGEYHRYMSRIREYGSDNVILVGLEDHHMLSADSIRRLQEAVKLLEQVADVARVESILDASSMEGDGKVLRMNEYAALALAHPDRAPQLKAQMMADPLLGQFIVASDGNAHALTVELEVADRPGERFLVIVQEVREALEAAGYDDSQIHLAGFTTGVAETINQMQFNLKYIFPVVGLLLLLLVWLMFRRLWPAAVALAVAMMAVTWTVGFMVALEGTIHMIASLTPPVILTVAFSDVVHLCSAYLTAIERGVEKDEAVRMAGVEVGKACFLTSATTFAGFLSLGLMPQPAMRVVALSLSFGVGTALLIALTLAPVLFSLLKKPKPLRKGLSAHVHTGLDAILAGAHRLSTTKPLPVIAAFGVLTIVACIGAPQFSFDMDFEKRFDQDNRLSQDTDWFAEEFGGTNTLEVYVSTGEKEGLLDPTVMQSIAAYQDKLESLPEVRSAVSLVDLFREVHKDIVPDRALTEPLPSSRRALAQYLVLFESAGGDNLDRLVNFYRQEMRITLRLNSRAVRVTAAVGGQASKLGHEYLAGKANWESSGLLYLLGHFLEEILASQKTSVALSIVVIALMMMMGLRSIRGGAVSMIPNLLPVVVLAGWLGYFADHVDSDVLLVMIMAIGIGVDDTIHFLMRYRVELDRCGDSQEALKGSFAFAGRGILMTTITLVAGFGPCAASGFVVMDYLGFLLPMALIVALAADVLLVPALITVGWLRLPVFRASQRRRGEG